MGNHWYHTDGTPCHTIIGKNGKERDTTLRDARRLNLVPSVTTILKGVLAAPALSRWITKQALEQAYNAPPVGDESLEDCISFWLRKSEEEGQKRMDFGTKVHKAIEDGLGDGYENELVTLPTGDDMYLAEFVNPVLELIKDNGWKILETETTLVGQGYAGTADAIYTGEYEYGIIDFKTSASGFVPPEYAIQIALYHVAEHGGIDDRAVGHNILIDTGRDYGAVKLVSYDADKLRGAYGCGMHLVKVWQYLNNYTPEQ